VYNIQSNQGSNYNALQFNLEKRLAHSVSAKGFYTWAHTLESNSLDGNALTGVFVDYNYQGLEKKQRSPYDYRHVVSASVVWRPDYFSAYNRTVRTVFNGWTLTALVSLNSGPPFTVTTGVDNYFDGQGNNRPSTVPGQTAQTYKSHSRVAEESDWFNKSAYCVTGTAGCPGVGPLSLLGTERPMQLSSPGYRDIDASLFRDIQIHDQLRFQVRGEAVNVFNLTNLGAPSTAMNSSTYGEITGSAGTNRIIQIGGRLLF
jgi:hypothetical protein